MKTKIQRRHLIVGGGLAAVASAALVKPALAAPNIVTSEPSIRWSLASSFPNNLDTLYGGSTGIGKIVSELTEGKFEIQAYQPGEIVPAHQAVDAVQNNTVEIAHTCGYYFTGKDPTFAFGTALPFGLNTRQQNAWLFYGGGNEAYNNFLANYNIYALVGGNTGAQMGGWFRKEIKSLDDLKGLKMRIAGIAGEVMQRLGVVPQQLPGGDLYPSLERGALDAVEWVGPYDDEKLGFYQVAPFYYYPAFWEAGPSLHFYINKDTYAKLPERYKAALDVASRTINANMISSYDVKNTLAIRELVGKGVKLRPLPRDIMDSAYKVSFELYDEYSSKYPEWAKLYPQWKKFRGEIYEWFRVAEYSDDSYAYAMQASGK